MPIDKDSFLNKYNYSEDDLTEYQIEWETLMHVYNDYIEHKEDLEAQAHYVANVLRKSDKAHTVSSRIKDPEHLIAKLIRKTPERQSERNNEFQFSTENYIKEITDLIGVRVLHVFKEDWKDIHDYINSKWNITEVIANIRQGDNTDIYTSEELNIETRETGYRSIHYLISFTPQLHEVVAEIQVRTVFEEGYAEIDHILRYPNNNVPDILNLNLLMLNRLAGSADEMSSYVNHLKNHLEQIELNHDNIVQELIQQKEKLEIEINESTLNTGDKISFTKNLSAIDFNRLKYNFSSSTLPVEYFYNTDVLKNMKNFTKLTKKGYLPFNNYLFTESNDEESNDEE